MEAAKQEIDMDLYSRQIGALGADTMGKLVKMNVVIYGMKGVGVEVAKNIILAGPKSVTLMDDNNDSTCRTIDQNTNFYITDQHVQTNKTRAQACLDKLKELNPYVKVEVKTGTLNEGVLAAADVVVVTDGKFNNIIEWNNEARKNNTAFIWTENRGVSGFVFSDFGDSHKILDRNGEPPIARMVTSIDFDEKDDGKPIFTTDERHKLEDGDVVLFEEAKGKYEDLNGKKFTIKTIKGNTFTVDKKEWEEAGKPQEDKLEYYFRMTQQKVAKELKFRSLMESIPNPIMPDQGGLAITDFAFWDRPTQLHFVQIALSLFKDKNGRFPDPKNLSEAKRLFQFAQDIADKHQKQFVDKDQQAITVEKLDECLIKKIALYSSYELPGYTAFLGGLVAQEVVKFTGKYTPLRQWLHLECTALVDDQVIIKELKMDKLPFTLDKEKGVITAVEDPNKDKEKDDEKKEEENAEAPKKSEFKVGMEITAINNDIMPATDKRQFIDRFMMSAKTAKVQFRVPRDDEIKEGPGTRYDAQIGILGRQVHNTLTDMKVFLVGAGALGCEYLKALALLGVGVSQKGKVHVTDMDRIEISNLNRQFLFRKADVGNPKSTTAANAVTAMNPAFKPQSYEVKVCPDTEKTYNDDFWKGLDVVVNALDNVKARQYVDSKCVFHAKPLFESGTLGTKANAQVIIPYKTESYADGEDPEEDGIPMCTLRNFPNKVEHCIEWARAEFNDLFVVAPQEVNTYIADSAKWINEVKAEQSEKEKVEKLESLIDWLKAAANPSLNTCAEIAYKRFHHQHRDRINKLTECFPKDARVTNKDGSDAGPFWSGARRFPESMEYKQGDEDMDNYMFHYTSLVAFSLKMKDVEKQKILDLIKDKKAPEYKAGKAAGDKVKASEDEKYEPEDDEDALKEKVAALLKEIETLKKPDEQVQPSEFEKDDDSNHHIDFITACSNLRCRNYTIKPVERHKVKLIAGKIIPALATTTAMITGLITVELYKWALGYREIEQYRNSYCNLGISQVLNQVEPTPAKKKQKRKDPATMDMVYPVPDGWTSWDKIEIKGDQNTTVKQFVEMLKDKHHGVDASMVLKYGITQKEIDEGKGKPLWNGSQFPKSLKESNAKIAEGSLFERYKEIYGPVSETYIILDVECTNKDGDDAEVPQILFSFQ